MNNPDSKMLIPFIDSYFQNGLSVKEMNISGSYARKLQAILNAWEYFKENPWVTDMRKYFRQQGVESHAIASYVSYLEYIKSTYPLTTRAEAMAMADYAARTALRQASNAGDSIALLRAANSLVKIHQLDKPETDKNKSRLEALPIVFTPYVEDIDPERKTIDDPKMLAIMRKFGAGPDKMEEKIADFAEKIKNGENI